MKLRKKVKYKNLIDYQFFIKIKCELQKLKNKNSYYKLII